MPFLILWSLNILVAYFITLFTLNTLIGVDVRSGFALFIFMLGWATYGRHIGKKNGYFSILSSWYTPFISFDINFCAILIALLSFGGFLTIDKYLAWDLAWAIIPTIPINLVILTLLPFFHGTPYIRTITLISTLEVFLIMALVVFIFNIDYIQSPLFEPKSSINLFLIIFSHIFITIFSFTNIYCLRGFEFYQKMTTNQGLASKLSHKRKMKIAVHEASHAVMYAYFEKMPEDLRIYLYEKAMNIKEGSLGLVVAKIPMSKSKELLEWEMLLSIAGNRGEIIVYGNNHSMGSDSDFKAWQALAVEYLDRTTFNYKSQPSTPSEMHKNKKMESDLFEKHTNIVDTFLKKNKKIVLAIARQAMVFHSLESHHLKPHFEKLVITPKFPIQKKKGLF